MSTPIFNLFWTFFILDFFGFFGIFPLDKAAGGGSQNRPKPLIYKYLEQFREKKYNMYPCKDNRNPDKIPFQNSNFKACRFTFHLQPLLTG